MNHTLYVASTFVHILAATFWIGSMLFFAVVLIPALRAQGNPALTARLVMAVGPRYRSIGWIALVTLIVTGLLNLHARGISHAMLADPVFWQSAFGQTLEWKLSLFGTVLVLSILHDGLIGPRFRKLVAANGDPASTERYRKIASWMGRLTMILSIVIVLLGVMLVRGRPW